MNAMGLRCCCCDSSEGSMAMVEVMTSSVRSADDPVLLEPSTGSSSPSSSKVGREGSASMTAAVVASVASNGSSGPAVVSTKSAGDCGLLLPMSPLLEPIIEDLKSGRSSANRSIRSNQSGISGGGSLSVVSLGRKSFRSLPTSLSFASLDSSLKEFVDPQQGLRRCSEVQLPDGNIHDKYRIVRKLGEGSFGKVMLVCDRGMETYRFAMKVISLENIVDTDRFEQELSVARRLQHPNIIRLHEFWEQDQAYLLIMDMCYGGDLNDLITKRAGMLRPGCKTVCAGLPTTVVAQYAWQMLSGIAYLHRYKFAHRDIKPENYLLESSSSKPGGQLKLIDFGLARRFPEKGSAMTTRVGSPNFVAPEVIDDDIEGYNELCDVWSAGVTVWYISVGSAPFEHPSPAMTLKNVISGRYAFTETWEQHSHPPELTRLVAEMMTKDPKERPSAHAILSKNTWLRKIATDEAQRSAPSGLPAAMLRLSAAASPAPSCCAIS